MRNHKNKKRKVNDLDTTRLNQGASIFGEVSEAREWTRLEQLQHRQRISKNPTFGIDFGMSELLTEEAIKKPLITAILNNKATLPTNNIELTWYYLLNFACAAGSENSVKYILEKLMKENENELREVLSDNTAFCYAASSGNMELCKMLMNDPYNCEIDNSVKNYAALSGDTEFIHEFLKYSSINTNSM